MGDVGMLGLLAAVVTACTPPAGTTLLLDRPERIIVLGETHGTTEGPAAFGEIACSAAEKGPVTVALEYSDLLQTALDAFLAAPDDEAAQEALRGSLLTTARFQDGRTSQAMLDLLLRVRQLKLQGRDVALHAVIPSAPRPAPTLGQAWGELAMAYGLSGAVYHRPDAKILFLVGSFHARKTARPDRPRLGLPAVAHFPALETLSLYLAEQGGKAWTCMDEDCAPHERSSDDAEQPTGISLSPHDDGAFDGFLAVGPTTASPPLRLD